MITQVVTKQIIDHCKNQEMIVTHNTELFNIFEGDLLTYVKLELAKCFSVKTFEKILPRIAPINVLKKIIDKLSKIYQQNVIRSVEYGTGQDSELLKDYEYQFAINQKMNQANEFFNLFKNSLIQIYYHPQKRLLQTRVLPSNQFSVWSNDPIEPNIPTHIILYYGKVNNKKVYCIYSDQQFVIVDEDNEICSDLMIKSGNPEGVIPWGQMPFIYINKSLNQIIPIPDSDTLKMTKLIPILLSDLNYAVMYQAFSIIYGIDVDDKNLEMNPSAFWHFKSDPNLPGQKPEVGMIKPQVDISETLTLIQAELAFWLETRGIKPGSLGTLSNNNFASGISKMIDEADTFEDRIKQIEYFKDAENRFWDLALNKMHNYFAMVGAIDNNYIFSSTAEICIKYPEQKPMISRADLVNTLKAERDAGFTSTERAIEMLNPDLNETDIAELILEIQAERNVIIQEAELPEGSDLLPTITEVPNADQNPASQV